MGVPPVVASGFSYFFEAIFCPSNAQHIGIFYFFWIASFMSVHILWDIFSPHTDSFHIGRLGSKTSVVYNAATFCSSFLLLLAIIEPAARTAAGEYSLPFALAGFSGIIQSLGAIAPYPPGAKLVVPPPEKAESPN